MKITPKMAREGKYNEGIQHQNAITSIAYALVMLPKVMPDYSCFDEFTAHSIFAAINETRKTRSAPNGAATIFSLNSLIYGFNNSSIRKAVQRAYPNRIAFVRRTELLEKFWKVTIDPDLVTAFESKGKGMRVRTIVRLAHNASLSSHYCGCSNILYAYCVTC